MKRIIALLCAVLLLPAFSSVGADGGLGEIYMNSVDTPANGLTYSKMYAVNGNGPQAGYAFTYTPGEDTQAMIGIGGYLYGRKTASEIAIYEGSTGKNILGSVNGNTFSRQSGIPRGLLISEGRLISWSDDPCEAVAVTRKGTVLNGGNDIALSVTVAENTYIINAVNKWAATEEGICLYTDDYSYSTASDGSRVEVVLKPTGELTLLDQSLPCTVTEVKTTADTDIPKGHVVLSLPASHDYAPALKALKKGDNVTLTSTAESWSGLYFATGTDLKIIDNGNAADTADSAARAQTAVGIKDDGSLVFFACDGDGGRGLSTEELCTELLSMGVNTAYLLDCGDNTTVTTGTTLANTPAKGEKPIGCSIIFVNTNKDSAPSRLVITPSSPTVLTNGFIDLSCMATDAAGRETGDTVTDVKYSLSSELGTVSGPLFKAGSDVGSVTVTATGRCNGKMISGSTVINIIDSLDGIKTAADTVYVPVGGRARIPVVGTRSDKDVYIYGYKLSWSLTDVKEGSAAGAVIACEYGYLDNRLTFHANEGCEGATFTLNAKLGNTVLPIKIVIGKPRELLNDFDDSSIAFSSYLQSGSTQTFRYAEGKFNTYGMTYTGKSVVYKTPYKLGYDAKELTLWIRGTAIDPYAVVEYGNGTRAELPYTCVDDYSAFNGWKKYGVSLPEDASRIISPLSSKVIMSCTVDHIEISYGTASPTFNDISSSWAKDDIEMLYAMDISSGYGTKGNLSYKPQNKITRAEFAKMIVSYYGLDTSDYSDTVLNFNDEDSIPDWALPYVRTAVGAGLIGGSSNPDGSLSFLPHDYITRAQVVTIVGRRIAAVPGEITFTDRADIPSYALEGLKRCVSAGIIGGYPNGSFLPLGTVTRAEVARIIANLYKFDY